MNPAVSFPGYYNVHANKDRTIS